MNQLSFLSEEPPANPSASQDSEKDWMIRVATSCLPTLRLLQSIGPSGWFGRMSPASYPPTGDEILPPYFAGWQNSGMGGPTECLTLNSPEHPGFPEQSHSDDGVSLLSDILETGIVPQRYFLSAKASSGILRRAEKRGKALPEALRDALLAAASRE